MKMFFIDLQKLKPRIYVFLLSILLIVGVLFTATNLLNTSEATTTPQPERIKIAIDAGHGGYDPGTSFEGVIEKDVNLAVALKLRDVLLLNGYDVLVTRDEDEDFLLTSGPKKQKDMNARKQMIEEYGTHYLISIHSNSIPSPKWKGAQVFYQSERDQSQKLAMLVQDRLRNLTDTTREAKPTDFYLTRETEIIGIVVEVGFLTNPEDRANLINEEYQYKLAWAIAQGMIEYLEVDRNRPPM